MDRQKVEARRDKVTNSSTILEDKYYLYTPGLYTCTDAVILQVEVHLMSPRSSTVTSEYSTQDVFGQPAIFTFQII